MTTDNELIIFDSRLHHAKPELQECKILGKISLPNNEGGKNLAYTVESVKGAIVV